MKGKIVAPLAIPPRPEGRPTFICGTESSKYYELERARTIYQPHSRGLRKWGKN